MQRDKTTPCYGCTQRSEMCHTKEYGCKPYQEYLAQKEARKAENRREFMRGVDLAVYAYDKNTRIKRRKWRPS